MLDCGKAATHLRLSFQETDINTASGQQRGDGQPADATANDDDFIFHLVNVGDEQLEETAGAARAPQIFECCGQIWRQHNED